MTAQLSWHVQKFAAIWKPWMELQFREYLVEFEFWVKNGQQQSYVSVEGSVIPCEIFIVNYIGHARVDKGSRKLWNKLTLWKLNCLEET